LYTKTILTQVLDTKYRLIFNNFQNEWSEKKAYKFGAKNFKNNLGIHFLLLKTKITEQRIKNKNNKFFVEKYKRIVWLRSRAVYMHWRRNRMDANISFLRTLLKFCQHQTNDIIRITIEITYTVRERRAHASTL